MPYSFTSRSAGQTIAAAHVNALQTAVSEIGRSVWYPAVAADGTTDDTTTIQDALDAAAAAGGGIVVLPAGTITHSGLDLPQRVSLIGRGRHATILYLRDGSDGNSITIHRSTDVGVADPNGQFITIANLAIDGNKANQASGHGIYSSPDPATPSYNPTADLAYDAFNIFRDLWIVDVKQNGIETGGRSENRFEDVFVHSCDGHGFVIGFDSFAVNCSAGETGLCGFQITSPSVRLLNCKAFYAGQLSSSNGHGFRVQTMNGGTVVISGCEAQDNRGKGFAIDTASFVSIVGCTADSNARGSGGDNVAVDLWEAYDCFVEVICIERNVTTTQKRALQIRSNSARNTIRLKHAGTSGVTVETPIASASTAVAGNDIAINNELGSQTPAYAASFTPNPLLGGTIHMTLTGNITVNAASNARAGQQLRFVFTQDATGGRTVTWNSVYKVNVSPNTAGGKVNTVTFVYDGTNWVQVASAGNL